MYWEVIPWQVGIIPQSVMMLDTMVTDGPKSTLSIFLINFDVGVLNQSASLTTKILSPCASKSGMDMLKSFLGREPSLDAFCRSHGC